MRIAVTNPTDGTEACELQMMAESEADSVLLARLDRQYELVGMGRDAESGLVMHARVRLRAKGLEKAMKPELIKQLVEAANMVVKQHDYRELGKPHVPDAIAYLRMAVASIEPLLNEQETQESYAARQAAWVEANGVKVGSKVRLLREPKTKEDGWGDCAVAGMGNYVGRVGAVLELSDTTGVYVDGPTKFWFPYFVLEPVEPAAQPPLQVREPDRGCECRCPCHAPGTTTIMHCMPCCQGQCSVCGMYVKTDMQAHIAWHRQIAEVPPPSEEAKPSPPTHHTAKDFLGKWCPDYDPITLAPFFMWIEDESGQWVPTYGGPYDSYTLSQPYELKDGIKRVDIEYHRKRFCHDEGCWRESETLCERVVSEEMLIELGVWDEKEVPPPSESPVMETPDKVASPEPEREATYRAFASAAEFAPHRDRWIRLRNNTGCWRANVYTDTGVFCMSEGGQTYEALLECVWNDDGTPCGVRESEAKS